MAGWRVSGGEKQAGITTRTDEGTCGSLCSRRVPKGFSLNSSLTLITRPYDVATFTVSVLKRRKLTHRRVKRLAQGHTASKRASQGVNSRRLSPGTNLHVILIIGAICEDWPAGEKRNNDASNNLADNHVCSELSLGTYYMPRTEPMAFPVECPRNWRCLLFPSSLLPYTSNSSSCCVKSTSQFLANHLPLPVTRRPKAAPQARDLRLLHASLRSCTEPCGWLALRGGVECINEVHGAVIMTACEGGTILVSVLPGGAEIWDGKLAFVGHTQVRGGRESRRLTHWRGPAVTSQSYVRRIYHLMTPWEVDTPSHHGSQKGQCCHSQRPLSAGRHMTWS